jgi:hypothetical protein
MVSNTRCGLNERRAMIYDDRRNCCLPNSRAINEENEYTARDENGTKIAVACTLAVERSWSIESPTAL